MMHSLISSMALETWQVVLCLGVLLVVLFSTLMYWRRARRSDGLIHTAIISSAGFCFCMMIIAPSLPLQSNPLRIDSSESHHSMAQWVQQSQHADSYQVHGDGLRWMQWQDLPRLPMQITTIPVDPNSTKLDEVLDLDFPTQLTQGRMFHLSVQRQHVDGEWRLQLLAENQQVLAETRGREKQLSLQWLPPAVERLVLQAKILDQHGRVIEQGPIPLEVIAPQSLLVQARFAAPSFDAKVLNALLSQSQAKLDWQTKLGKTVTRFETADNVSTPTPTSTQASTAKPDLLIQDAAYFEQQNVRARAQVLQQVAAGSSLIILGANASDIGLWRRELDLRLQASDTSKEITIDPLKSLSPSAWTPQVKSDANWYQVKGQSWMAQRAWGQGQIVWLSVANWHRYQISATNSLQAWWQTILDQAKVKKSLDWEARFEPRMPIVGQRMRLCAQGFEQAELVLAGHEQGLPLLPVRDHADAQCASFWPEKPAWLDWQAQKRTKSETKSAAKVVQGKGTSTLATGVVYVYQPEDWPAWQRAQARADTAAMLALVPVVADNTKDLRRSLPTWPWALGLLAAMLLLWWREQRDK
ncbi:hypothetical protein [Undibacterium baiyunense]|uniref:Uncharacterized protein n=1 Tax=Undibacterium baiyunense TaxID=2828731 RepID=A0A941DCV7_9BURK|nr:hypothetical protein [Undibacterium baiyunense]MBR7745696.1 hypothetical protein [Undibacterium baiyunense]